MANPAPSAVLRLAAIADLHYSLQAQASLVPMLGQLSDEADVLLLCGDLTHHGRTDEALAMVRELSALRTPMLAVLGNHDHHSDQQDEIKRVLVDSSIHLLDGDATEVRGVGFAGVKGFASGFGRYILEPWGERVVKEFVHEAVEEALRLESALASLRTPQRV